MGAEAMGGESISLSLLGGSPAWFGGGWDAWAGGW